MKATAHQYCLYNWAIVTDGFCKHYTHSLGHYRYYLKSLELLNIVSNYLGMVFLLNILCVY